MTKRAAPHPILPTPRLWLRQFRIDDTEAMHACFAEPEAMRFWDSLVARGFRPEGMLRDNLPVGAVWRDDMLYALLGTERGTARGPSGQPGAGTSP